MAWKLNHPLKVRCIDDSEYLRLNMQAMTVTEQRGTNRFLISLTKGKIYEVSEIEEEFGYYRIVDDTGEDYLYPAYMFEPVEGQDIQPEIQGLFPIRFGLRLKRLGVSLNDESLGKWHQIVFRRSAPVLRKRMAYEAAWKLFFRQYDQQGGLPTQDEAKRFARSLAKRLNIESE